MGQPSQPCMSHHRPATFVNIKNGDLLCDLDERLLRGSALHDALRPRAEVDLASLAPKPPAPPTRAGHAESAAKDGDVRRIGAGCVRPVVRT